MNRPDFIDKAVISAISEDCSSDGLMIHLKALVCKGYRSDITESILDVLQKSNKFNEKINALELIYYLHGTDRGVFFDPDMPDPRPELGREGDRIRPRQLERLCHLAVLEQDPKVWNDYSGILDCIVQIVRPTLTASKEINDFCKRAMSRGEEYAINRCKKILRILNSNSV